MIVLDFFFCKLLKQLRMNGYNYLLEHVHSRWRYLDSLCTLNIHNTLNHDFSSRADTSSKNHAYNSYLRVWKKRLRQFTTLHQGREKK